MEVTGASRGLSAIAELLVTATPQVQYCRARISHDDKYGNGTDKRQLNLNPGPTAGLVLQVSMT